MIRDQSTLIYACAAILVMGLITFALRALPFLVFRNRKPAPWLMRVQEKLPGFMMLVLSVYSLKDLAWGVNTAVLAPLAGVLVTLGLHAWRRNALLSIVAGTAVYMTLLNLL